MTKIELLTMIDADLDKAVKISGTMYDRKRKYGKADLKKMASLFKKGKTYADIAKEIGCSRSTVRYNLDEDYRKQFNATRDGKHTGKDRVTPSNRVAYKRTLVAQGKITA